MTHPARLAAFTNFCVFYKICNLLICTIHDFSSLIIILQVRMERLKWASNNTAENVFVG